LLFTFLLIMGKRDAEEAALAEKKAAKKAKKAAAEEEVEEEDTEAAALVAKKAAKKAKKAAAAAAAAAEAEEEEDPEAAALAAKKAAKKAKKAAAAAAAAAEEEETAPKPKPKEEGKKAEPAKPAAAEDEEWKDLTYKCCDCNEDWIDTAEDQEWRHSMGFGETPKRCKDCRWAKKVRMEGGDPTAKGKGKKGKGKGGDENTVFVRGLPWGTTEEALTKDFTECGEIVNLRMPMDEETGNPRGFAFITYTDKAGMDKAMAFNETDYGGRTIYCSDAAIKPDKGKGKGKDGKDKGKDKGKGKKGKKGKAPTEAFAKSTGAMVASTGKKTAFVDSDDE